MCLTHTPQKSPMLATHRMPLMPRASATVPRSGVNQSTTQTVREASNIVPACPYSDLKLSSRRQELELQAKALLEQDSRWFEGDTPSNLVQAASPKHFKQLITGARPGQLIVVDYFAPHCIGCRTLYPKLKQIAANKGDCIFIKVNTDSDDMRELAQNLGVTKLPFFQLWRDSEIVAGFTANVSTVSVIRSEIASHADGTGSKLVPRR